MVRAGGDAVSCTGLSRSFGGREAVKSLELAIAEGSIVGLIGPSGCGKTTTVRLLVGLLEPTAGRASVWGTDSTQLSSRQRQRIGYLPQIPTLFPGLTAWENLSFHASMYGLRLRRRHRLRHVLEWVELEEHRDKRVCEMSGGMQRRLALAAAFIHDPTLVFLDEPTAGIDPILRSSFWDQFRQMRDEGCTLCVTTQYVGEAAFCDYVGLLSDGELLMFDTPAQLRTAAFQGEVLDIEMSREVDPAQLAELARLHGVISGPDQVRPRVWRIVVDDANVVRRRVDDVAERLRLPIIETEEHVVDFDEAFVRVIERHRCRRGRRARVRPGGARRRSIRGSLMPTGRRRLARRERRDLARQARLSRLRQGRRLRVNPVWATAVRAFAFVRKELAEIVRQPKLLVLLVVGPFLLLVLFGAGYQDAKIELRTEFVGPADSIYERVVNEYADQLDEYIDSAGFSSDVDAAVGRLNDGEIDAVVVFPTDALERVLGGERAEIQVLHEKLDPFEQTAIDIASRLAVQEVNSSILSALAGGAQTALAPVDDAVATLVEQAAALSAAVASNDTAAMTDGATSAGETLRSARVVIAASIGVVERLGGDPDLLATDLLDRVDGAIDQADATAADQGATLTEQASQLAARLEEVADAIPSVATVDPAVLVRPFDADTENISPVEIEPVDFFAPASIALLLQHLALTFAALSLVRDREVGLFELLRVGPLSSPEILFGKTVAYLVVGVAVGASLVAAAVLVLGVPLQGSIVWIAGVGTLLLVASLALGMVISMISGSETQAVQYAMLTLLAGMFFSGFFLDLSQLATPYRYLSYLLPVTYGISALHDVMLRGIEPSPTDLIGLSSLIVAYGLLAVLLLRRELRVR